MIIYVPLLGKLNSFMLDINSQKKNVLMLIPTQTWLLWPIQTRSHH